MINSLENNTTLSNTEKIASLTYLKRYLKPYKFYIYLMILALLVTSSSVLMIGKGLQYIIDKGISAKDSAMLDTALFFMIVVTIVLAIATSCRYYLITYVGEKTIADIRSAIYDKILELSPSFFEVNKSGEILSRLTSDTTLLLTIMSSSISIAIRNAVMLLGGILLLIATSPKLAGIIAFVIPLVVLPLMYFGRRMRKYSKLSQDKVADLSAWTEETIGGIKIIQAYTREDFEREIFNQKVLESVRAATDRIQARSLLICLVISLIFGAIGMILWIGGHDVLTGNISPGELMSFIFISIVCAGAVAALTDVAGDLQKAAGATERLVAFLNLKSEIVDKGDATFISEELNNLRFENVTFYYPSRPSKPCLEEISFNVEPGTVTALVGESGAGKSTIVQLLLRFYDIGSGKIILNDRSIDEYKLSSLRQQFAYVSQDLLIFSANVYENIRYGNPKATDEEVRVAAEAAAALEFIEKLPNKFETFLGEKGVRLSGGQKQRIAIARAFLKNPKILLLDEATSSLDSKNESLVQMSLERIMRGRTTIVVAHRLSTIRSANNIIVLRDGKIIEQGTHLQLMNKNFEYARLVSIQENK